MMEPEIHHFLAAELICFIDHQIQRRFYGKIAADGGIE